MLQCLPVALSALILVSAIARADDKDFCQGTTQYEMNMCAAREFEETDREMNARYAALMGRLGPEEQTSLRETRRAWETYRHNMCLFEAMGLGSARPMVFSGCLTKLTQEHVKLLDYHLTCQEGDLSCKGR
ncbi:lysozyme inhibitor LprI family protein [Microvirga sp. 2MCAF38]|uniref:lysozyme inhibitor LprI family protein n=1 Tax=Microvirga sp. 2MCAF38 TaxID=3232989 RepID=UPI003F989ABD